MYRFSNDGWSWFINSYGDKITTSLITSASAMFNNSSSLLAIPFSLNFSQFTNVPIENMFRGCKSLKEAPPLMMKNATASISASYVFSDCNMLERIGRIDNLYPTSIGNMFYGCYRLRELPEMTNWHWDKI
jgi:hypothetical protein